MEHFTWSRKYSVGNEELDNHHKNLFEVFNKLYDSCLNKNRTKLSAVIEELVAYSTYHFHAEEQHMKSIEYPDINKHLSEHRSFSAMIGKYHHTHGANEVMVSKEIVLHLWKWLIDHVMTEDRKYSIKSKRPVQRIIHDEQA
ncbi:bacteriohemerythrin [Geobacter sp. AOG2]|uniref:bacteriohemerythrin n=1 Tax=Geobacter sp. AOG2 TaxID=1566347 RepID=UPI001CC42774|nr:bacteriohemerythrin [Geobacter sp. AOG2]GFE62830.1 hemerythrin [Geobacter sp. AOG2]